MFLLDRILLENELERQYSFLQRLEEKMLHDSTELLIELKVYCMEKIGELNRKLYGSSKSNS